MGCYDCQRSTMLWIGKSKSLAPQRTCVGFLVKVGGSLAFRNGNLPNRRAHANTTGLRDANYSFIDFHCLYSLKQDRPTSYFQFNIFI